MLIHKTYGNPKRQRGRTRFEIGPSLTRFKVALFSHVVATAYSLGRKPQVNKAQDPLTAKRRQQNDDAQITVAASRLPNGATSTLTRRLRVATPFVGWTPRPTGKPFETWDGRGVHPTYSSSGSTTQVPTHVRASLANFDNNNRFTSRQRARGYTLLEVVISTMLVSVVLIGAMNLVGASIRGTADNSEQLHAMLLANDLLNEILQQEYLEPTDNPSFGTEGDEVDTVRTDWDDVDDYEDWDQSPPQEKDGTVIANATDWRRTVVVKHVDPADLSTELTNGNDQGVKKITVSVYRDTELLASLVTVHTAAWVDMVPIPGNDQTTGSKPPVNQPPTAVAGGSPTSGSENLTVNFDGSSSSDPDGDPLTYAWDFDDGNFGSGATPSHSYYNGGESTDVYHVTLTVTDSAGAQATDTIVVTVYGDD